MSSKRGKTKSKILDAALDLFNRNGVVNVRLQHIADEIIISVGNLAYHFANKEAIVTSLIDDMTDAQTDIFDKIKVVPLFEYMDQMLEATYALQNKYLFIYVDALELSRSYPELNIKLRQHHRILLDQIKHIVEFNIARGALVSMDQDRKQSLCQFLQQQLLVWHYMHALVKGGEEASLKDYKKDFWMLLRPYFNNMGSAEYRQLLENPYSDFFS